ncbi:MAG: hypothetical protein ACOVOP_04125 [Candidatus Planktophila sp.]
MEIHSTRLFPKHKGADLYQITGIAARCDWVLLSDDYPPHTHLIKRRDGKPKTIFISLRSPFHALSHFFGQVLPCIDNQFVLISGSEDATLPLQIDHRWRQYTEEESNIIAAILNDQRLITWAAENLVSANHPRWQPLPLGMLPHDLSSDPLINDQRGSFVPIGCIKAHSGNRGIASLKSVRMLGGIIVP